jgi:hypothetical protein
MTTAQSQEELLAAHLEQQELKVISSLPISLYLSLVTVLFYFALLSVLCFLK